MHFVVDQMVQLQDVHVANGGGPIKRVPGAPVIQMRLRPGRGQALGQRHGVGVSELEHGADVFLARPIEHGGCKRNAGGQILGHPDHLVVAQIFERLAVPTLVVECFHELTQLCRLAFGLEHVAQALSNAFGRPAQVHFQHLTHVHAGRHAQGVQHDVARRAVGHVRHVFHRDDLGDHPFVAVATGHLVTGLQAALDGQVDLDHFEHARWQLVALGEFFALFFKCQVKTVARLGQGVFDALELHRHIVIGGTDIEPVKLLDIGQIGGVNLGTLGQFVGATVGGLARQQLGDTVKGVGLNNAQLVIQVQAKALELVVNDLLRALVTLNAFTGEDLHIDHRAL